MSDKEIVIIRLLESAERRLRRNRRLHEIAAILAISLLLPVTFKLLDLYFLFRGATVVAFFTLWAAATGAYVLWRSRGRNSLSQIAATLDRRALLQDQLKTAYWFIQNPRASDWVEEQIRKTAENAHRIDVNTLYPRRFPKASFLAAGLLCLLVALNFIPLSLNHNWMYLQAAPPFHLTNDEQENLEATLRLLNEAKAEGNEEIIEKIEEIIEDLQQGDITVEEAIQQLEDLQRQLEEGNLDLANLTIGLEEMAAILSQSAPLEPVAEPMSRGELVEAAAELREVASNLQDLSPAGLREIEGRFRQASENPAGSLETLARAFEATASGLQRADRAAAAAAMERAARELERLMEQIEEQEARNDAGEELGELADSLGDRSGSEGDPSDGESESQGEAQEGPPSEGMEGGEPGEIVPGEPGQSGEPGELGEAPEGGEAGEGGGTGEASGPNGKGGTSFGGSKESAPVLGEATSLEVQLQKELLEMRGEAGNEPATDEAAGERERSKLDYRNVPSSLTPGQKDLLNQERIPWESRQLIRNYFQAVKPQQEKK
jgi:hypothetical protein